MKSNKKKIFLSKLFTHLDGIVLIPTLLALEKKNIVSNIKETCNLTEISKKYKANEAYLNVALRLLCSQGMLIQKIGNNDEIYFQKSNTKIDFTHIIDLYNLVSRLYSHQIDYTILYSTKALKAISHSVLFQILNDYIYQYKNLTKITKYDIHIEGAILGPILVTLSRKGILDNPQELRWIKEINPHFQQPIRDLFITTKLLNPNNTITQYGQFIFKRVTSYGVTVSYLPTFKNIENLIFGDFTLLWNKFGETEKHVDRSMNVWGSGGSHKTYFQKIDNIIIDLFNLPINKQPKGFIDIGCGNGKLIEHVFDIIYYKTNRGKQLDKHPLIIIGSDFNQKALEATQKTIQKADIWAQTAIGDISDPETLAKKIKNKYQINLEDLLNIRSFLDHNRIYTPPKQKIYMKSKSSGAFCFQGERINNATLQQNLKEHLEKWCPYLKKYGLLIVELHTIHPEYAANNIGKTAITAYDASHGFSDQYIIEYDIFLQTALQVGLKPDPAHEYILPSSKLPVVSINRLIKA